jgi:hypothetical protein
VRPPYNNRMSAIVLKPCCICRQVASKKLSGGKSKCKNICGSAVAHRECLEQYCVFCGQYAQESNFKVCISCGSKIHAECERKESRRPESRRLGHNWTAVAAKVTERTDPVDFGLVDDFCPRWSWADDADSEVTTLVNLGSYQKTTTKKKK